MVNNFSDMIAGSLNLKGLWYIQEFDFYKKFLSLMKVWIMLSLHVITALQTHFARELIL